MTDLIERLERADGPSRELDFAILCEIDPRVIRSGPVYSDPRYTASIDAAMTLVPEGPRRIEFGTYEQGGNCWAYVHTPNDTLGEADDAATEAIALCIATLRAKEADNG